jgi:hypothetical protein
MPRGGVAMLPPRPTIGSRARRGSINSTDSLPRTQCGTMTGSAWTLSSPSLRISASTQSIACSRLSDPLKRLPKRSVSSASRSQAELSAPAAAISRSATAR